jgi:hypothetical protein
VHGAVRQCAATRHHGHQRVAGAVAAMAAGTPRAHRRGRPARQARSGPLPQCRRAQRRRPALASLLPSTKQAGRPRRAIGPRLAPSPRRRGRRAGSLRHRRRAGLGVGGRPASALRLRACPRCCQTTPSAAPPRRRCSHAEKKGGGGHCVPACQRGGRSGAATHRVSRGRAGRAARVESSRKAPPWRARAVWRACVVIAVLKMRCRSAGKCRAAHCAQSATRPLGTRRAHSCAQPGSPWARRRTRTSAGPPPRDQRNTQTRRPAGRCFRRSECPFGARGTHPATRARRAARAPSAVSFPLRGVRAVPPPPRRVAHDKVRRRARQVRRRARVRARVRRRTRARAQAAHARAARRLLVSCRRARRAATQRCTAPPHPPTAHSPHGPRCLDRQSNKSFPRQRLN